MLYCQEFHQQYYNVAFFLQEDIVSFPADAYIVVFSVHDHMSFVVASEYLQYLRNELDSDRPIVLVANKVDLVRKRQISADGEFTILTHYNESIFLMKKKRKQDWKELSNLMKFLQSEAFIERMGDFCYSRNDLCLLLLDPNYFLIITNRIHGQIGISKNRILSWLSNYKSNVWSM